LSFPFLFVSLGSFFSLMYKLNKIKTDDQKKRKRNAMRSLTDRIRVLIA